jgi:hypothetical protein
MNEGGYDPRRFTAARRALEEHLRQASPETWRVLDDPEIGFSYMAEALVFSFPSDNEDVFKRMTMAPSLVILKGGSPSSAIQRQAEMRTERSTRRGAVIERKAFRSP